MSVSKEYKIVDEFYPRFNTKYGSTDKDNPEVIYLRSKVTFTPVEKKRLYSDEVKTVKGKVEKYMENIISSNVNFLERHILTVEMSEESVMYSKNSRIKYDLFLKPANMKPLEEHEEIIKNLNHTFNDMIKETLENNGFRIN